MADTPLKVLVVGPSWVGDMVMAQSLFKVLKARHPGIHIDVLAPGWTLPLLERMPEVQGAVEMPLGHGKLGLRRRYRSGRGLREKCYAQAIVLPNSLKSALVPFWAAIPRRTGYRGELRWGLLNDVRRLDKTALPMTVQRFVALGQEPGDRLPDPVPVPALQVNPAQVDAALTHHGLGRPDRPVLGLCPGAEYGPAKRWPLEHFAELARIQRDRGWQVWLFGSHKEVAIGQELAERIGNGCVDLSGKTTLAEAVDLMSRVSVLVSNDSGLMHVAAALDRNLIALYGSSDPGFTPPLHPRAQVLRLGLACSPCFKRQCPLGHLKCLRDLEPQRVLGAIETFYTSRGAV